MPTRAGAAPGCGHGVGDPVEDVERQRVLVAFAGGLGAGGVLGFKDGAGFKGGEVLVDGLPLLPKLAVDFRGCVVGADNQGFVQAGTTDPKRILPPIAHEPTTKTGLSHIDGALSAPRFAPGTARGDFTIILGGAPWMDANPAAAGDNLGFAVFGRVVEGMDVVAKILAAPTSTTKGDGVFKGEILEPPVQILSARRVR